MHVRCARLVTPGRFAADRELACRGKTATAPSTGRLACAPGYKCMCVADERARRTRVPSRVLQERCAIIMALGDNARDSARTRAPVGARRARTEVPRSARLT